MQNFNPVNIKEVGDQKPGNPAVLFDVPESHHQPPQTIGQGVAYRRHTIPLVPVTKQGPGENNPPDRGNDKAKLGHAIAGQQTAKNGGLEDRQAIIERIHGAA